MLIRKWLSRWRLKRAYKRQDVFTIFSLLKEQKVFESYRPVIGMGRVAVWHFPNVIAFHDYLENALDLVREEGYTDRLKKDLEKRQLSLDDYMAYGDGRSVDVYTATFALVELYQNLYDAIDEHKEERKVYYRRHFSNTHTEMMVLLNAFRPF